MTDLRQLDEQRRTAAAEATASKNPDTDLAPLGGYTVGRCATPGELCPSGYRLAKAFTVGDNLFASDYLFILPEALPPDQRAQPAGFVPVVPIGEGLPTISGERTFIPLAAPPYTGAAPLFIDATAVTAPGDVDLSHLLSGPVYLGMYAPDSAEAPCGYTEIRDANGHRVFLNDQILREEANTIVVGKLMGTPGTPAPTKRFPTIELPAPGLEAAIAVGRLAAACAQQSGSAEPEQADPTGQEMVDALTRLFTQAPEEAAEIAAGDPGWLAELLGCAGLATAQRTITLDADWFARILGHFASVQAEVERLAEHATDLREQCDAATRALQLVTEGDPLPPTGFHAHPWAVDMMASLKRAREEAASARADADLLRKDRDHAIRSAAGAQEDISVRPAHLFSTKRHPAAPGLDGNEDPAGPDPQEA
jgi:hypothetical protein